MPEDPTSSSTGTGSLNWWATSARRDLS